MSFREPPDVKALLHALERHDVRYVVTGSVAALLLGIPVDPGDLDVTPALDRANLERLAHVLVEVQARHYPEEPFGRWELQDDGERRWIEFEPTAADRAARAAWRPNPDEPGSFDHLLETVHGALDIVPAISGAYDELLGRAGTVEIDGMSIRVESVEDQLTTLTVPRRTKDGARVRALRALQRNSGLP